MLPNLLFISILSSLIFTTHSSNSQCLDHQKSLLLQLRNELIFNSSLSTKLVKWNQRDDCCKWYGVECDVAGNIISLQLNNESISGGIGDSSSLFRLVHLQKLNLADNIFNNIRIPRGIRNLTYLTHLNLSYADFGGQVPAEISSLTRLVILDFSNYYFSVSLEYPNLGMLVRNLTGLRELYLDYVDMSSDERGKWSHIISSYLPHLTSLSLRYCSLSGPFARSFWQLHSLSILRLDGNDLLAAVPDMFANFSTLTTLSLAGCSLKGSFPNMIFHIPTLQNLDLSSNQELSGSIPPFTQTGSLKSLRLSGTNFSGLIPSSISKLTTLEEIDLSDCKFTGSIPSTFANLTQLIHVDLSYNSFTGSLSSKLLKGLSNLVYLDLAKNQLEGPIPDSLFQLESLQTLYLLGNMFNGTFQLHKIQRLANIKRFALSCTNLSVDVRNDNSSTYGLPKLQELSLTRCNLSAFPDFLSYSDMRRLDLSRNQIAGEIPNWIWGTQLQNLDLSNNLFTHLQKPYHIPASLQFLYLSSNQLRGELPIPPNIGNRTLELIVVYLDINRFSGSIPTSLCSMPSLYFLDLSWNQLSGSIPSCLLENLGGIDLTRNNISGHIPNMLSPYCNLQALFLSNNNLEGKIPKSLKSCMGLKVMDVGNNIINDTFPCMLPSSLSVLVLHSNRFHGEVKCQKSWPNLQVLDVSFNNLSGSLESINFSSWRAMVLGSDAHLMDNNFGYLWGSLKLIMKGLGVQFGWIWPEFAVIDLSCNNFQGEIPNAIGDLTSLHLLNFSRNALNGSIPKSIGQLRKLESLDLSRNQLGGAIPTELAELTFLSVLNLSYNNLVGEIPNGRQLQTFSADSFRGNPGLCGFNLNISCSSHTDDDDSDLSHENEEEKREVEWEYVCGALGYVVGLGSIVWMLLFWQSFRQKYFDKVDEIVEEMLDGRNRRRRRRRARRVVSNRVRRQ